MFGEHGLIDKRTAYEASMRVPMLVQCPALIKGGTVIDKMIANIDVAPTILEAMGLRTPAHMDGRSFLPLVAGADIPWRDHFLYVYYWEKDFPQTPTTFAIRGDRFKYITYYGLWDVDEFFDLQNDAEEGRNLINDPAHKKQAKEMERQLYAMMAEFGGMEVPLNPPSGGSNNIRLGNRGGARAADFPPSMVVERPVNQNAN
jgi:N-acetylglucosamine-6-sulfatase